MRYLCVATGSLCGREQLFCPHRGCEEGLGVGGEGDADVEAVTALSEFCLALEPGRLLEPEVEVAFCVEPRMHLQEEGPGVLRREDAAQTPQEEIDMALPLQVELQDVDAPLIESNGSLRIDGRSVLLLPDGTKAGQRCPVRLQVLIWLDECLEPDGKCLFHAAAEGQDI